MNPASNGNRYDWIAVYGSWLLARSDQISRSKRYLYY